MESFGGLNLSVCRLGKVAGESDSYDCKVQTVQPFASHKTFSRNQHTDAIQEILESDKNAANN